MKPKKKKAATKPKSEPKQPEEEAGPQITPEQYHEFRGEMQEMQQTFFGKLEDVYETTNLRNMWQDRIVGVQGVGTLKGIKSQSIMDAKLASAKALIQRADLTNMVRSIYDRAGGAKAMKDDGFLDDFPVFKTDPMKAELEELQSGIDAGQERYPMAEGA